MMPRIMAGMEQRDSYLVRVWQWYVFCCPRAVFPSLSSGPRCPSSWPAWTQVQFLDKVFYMPVVVLRVVPRSRQCKYTVWRFRSYSSSRSSHPRRGAEGFPMAQAVQQTIEIPLLPFRRFCCAGSASSLVAGVEKTAVSHIAVENTFEIPQLQLVDAGLRTRLAGSTGAVVEKTVVFSQFRPDWCSASVCRPAGSTGAVCEETVDIPLLLLHAGFAVH